MRTCLKIQSLAVFICTLLLNAQMAQAKVFKNSYISFELPNNWRCAMEGTEWTCFSQANKKRKQAVIIFTAKEKGPADTLRSYETQLKQTRTISGAKNKPIKSKVRYVKRYTFNNKEWVDSLHENSEVESYYTRYVATVSNGLGILITFSAHRAHYAAYAEIFRSALQSLKVTANSSTLLAGNSRPNPTPRQGRQNQPIGINPGVVNLEGGQEIRGRSSGGMSTTKMVAYLLIVLSIVGVVYYFIKTKK